MPSRSTSQSLRRSLLAIVGLVVVPVTLLWMILTQPMLPTRPNDAAVAVDPARLESHVRMLSQTLAPRDAGHPKNLDRAAAYIKEALARAGGNPLDQPYDVGGVSYRNVIAGFGPDTAERIVVGAHYDAYRGLPGADDNASGVAGLIELAGLLQRRGPKTRVELVAFSLEEPPYFRTPQMGSAVHAASVKAQHRRVRLMISLEMIGYFSDTQQSQRVPLPLLEFFYPSTGNFIAVVSRLDQIRTVRRVKQAMRAASPLPVCSINAPAFLPGIDLSDHRNYWKAGYDAIMITDTAFYRNPNYHTAKDTADTLDYGRMAMVVKGVHGAVLAFADQ